MFLDLQLIVGIVVAIIVSVAMAPFVARRCAISRAAAYLGTLSTVAILAITVFDRSHVIAGIDLGRGLTWWTEQRQSVIEIARSEPGWLLNVALFVPSAAIWTVITRRPIRVVLALAGCSFGIETVQALTGFGASDVTDLMANALGAGIGAATVARIGRVAPNALPDVTNPDPAPDDLRITLRWVAGSLLVTSLLIGAGLLGVQAVVHHRQNQLRDELERVFAGMTIEDVNVIRDPRAPGLSPFFGLVSIRPDSYRFYDDERPVEVRYPVDFLGAYRCVFVTFSTSPPVFTNGSGDECTEDRYPDTEPEQ